MNINELLALSEPYTREQYDADRVRVLARICEKHGITELEIEPLIREHRYVHTGEDIEDEYIHLAAVSRLMGWPLVFATSCVRDGVPVELGPCLACDECRHWASGSCDP